MEPTVEMRTNAQSPRLGVQCSEPQSVAWAVAKNNFGLAAARPADTADDVNTLDKHIMLRQHQKLADNGIALISMRM